MGRHPEKGCRSNFRPKIPAAVRQMIEEADAVAEKALKNKKPRNKTADLSGDLVEDG
jgi:hypothetical protein